MVICGREFGPELIARLNETGGDLSRRALSRQLCQWLDWKGPSGTWQTTNARIAVKRLEQSGQVQLPKPARPFAPRGRRARRSQPALLPLPPIRGPLAQIGPVELVLVGSRHSQAAAQCQQLLRQFHPLGARLCGAQLRYLLRCPQGVLGVLTFSAAARRLRARDTWIGWSEAARRENLHRVVNNTRFLLRPGVEVRHLASHVLGRAAQRLPGDWQQRYGYAPWLLETFVEKSAYRGTAYRAANWLELAAPTAGRGRNDARHRADKTPKRIFLHPLHRAARAALRQWPETPRLAPLPARKPAPPPAEPADWAEEELGRARLGDARLNRRLCIVARDFYARPQSNVPQSCNGDRAKSKAAYRLFDHPDVNLATVLQSHYTATAARVARETVVLAVQDTTTLNYSTHPATGRLGPIGPAKDGVVGLLVHDTLAFNLAGTPLGLLDVQCWARDPAQFGQSKKRQRLPLEQKESVKWLRSVEAVARIQSQCPQTQIVSVGDREADIYELFVWATAQPGRPQLLIRAGHNRCVQEDHGYVWEHLAAQPIAGIKPVRLPRRAQRPARTAELEVRLAQVELRAPAARSRLPNVRLWAVWAREVGAPAGVEPVEWMLWTTLPVDDFAQAQEKLDWYARRWGIEVYHRTLKSGCQIEIRQLGRADRIEGCLAIDLIVAWRIFHLTKLGRETPDVPCTVYFEELEWKALVGYIRHTAIAPKEPPSLREATRMVASLGGFLGRKGDGEPGTQTIWLGLQRLDDISTAWGIASAFLTPTVSSNREYG